MAEVTLLDALGPFINVMGGLAGLTIAYFILMLWSNKRKMQRIARIEREQERARERDHRLLRAQHRMAQQLERLDRKVTRWKRAIK